MEEIIGIDLGTTNSMAAWVSELGAEIIEDKTLSSWQASVVCYAEGKFFVGKEALKKKLDYPQSTKIFFLSEPFMGKKYTAGLKSCSAKNFCLIKSTSNWSKSSPPR